MCVDFVFLCFFFAVFVVNLSFETAFLTKSLIHSDYSHYSHSKPCQFEV